MLFILQALARERVVRFRVRRSTAVITAAMEGIASCDAVHQCTNAPDVSNERYRTGLHWRRYDSRVTTKQETRKVYGPGLYIYRIALRLNNRLKNIIGKI